MGVTEGPGSGGLMHCECCLEILINCIFEYVSCK